MYNTDRDRKWRKRHGREINKTPGTPSDQARFSFSWHLVVRNASRRAVHVVAAAAVVVLSRRTNFGRNLVFFYSPDSPFACVRIIPFARTRSRARRRDNTRVLVRSRLYVFAYYYYYYYGCYLLLLHYFTHWIRSWVFRSGFFLRWILYIVFLFLVVTSVFILQSTAMELYSSVVFNCCRVVY